jgi:hypothetical protein
MGLSGRVARLGKNENRGAARLRDLRKTFFDTRSKHAQSHRRNVARCSAMSSAVSNGGFAYEDDILEDTIL